MRSHPEIPSLTAALKPLRIIFLDIDGVLNDTLTWSAVLRTNALKASNVLRFAELCRELNARVVLSSTWRHVYNIDDILDSLIAFGFTEARQRYLTSTPWFPGEPRGREISFCLAELEGKYSGMYRIEYVVLDDNDGMDEVRPRFVQTHYQSGLQDNDCARVRELFACDSSSESSDSETRLGA